jgi:hypothetical protein
MNILTKRQKVECLCEDFARIVLTVAVQRGAAAAERDGLQAGEPLAGGGWMVGRIAALPVATG